MVPKTLLPWLAALTSLLALSLLLGLPSVPGHMLGPDHRGPLLELSLLLAGLSLWRGQPGKGTVWALGIGCWLVLLLRLADLVALLTAGRRFEPTFDPALVPALWDVVAAGPGGMLAALTLLAVLGGALCLCRRLAGLLLRPLPRHGRMPALAMLAALTLLAGQPLDRGPVGAIIDQAHRWQSADAMQARMADALAHDPALHIPEGNLFAALRGRTIILAWVESYGQSALTDPRQTLPVTARLAALDKSLSAAGFHIRSGLVESPVIGGRSWLAHGTLRAGIRQDQPLTQHLVLAAGRCGLVCALNRAGWRTMAAMPGLGLPWLEGPAWGFETVLDRAAFAYAGPAFGWSPMPDQALLASLRPDWAGPRPLYLEIVLTSSHAPWTPLPPWKDDAAGLADGSAYADATLTADYRDMAGAYGHALNYSLRALGDWLVAQAPRDALVIILGDHPALDWISGGQGQRVPVHFLSRDPALLHRLDGLDLTGGMMPAAGASPLPMWEIFPQLLSRFGPPPLQRPRIHADMQGNAGEAAP